MTKIWTAADRKEVALTIYNDGFALVKERRQFEGEVVGTRLIFADVAQRIEMDSLLVEGIKVLEFNYDFDLVNREKLLQKYIDREVFLRDRQSGVKKTCRLLSVEPGGQCVFEDSESKEIYLETEDELILPSLPSGLMVKPALVWKTDGSPVKEAKVSYLSGGFRWAVNYVLELKGSFLDLVGWAEIENTSGMTFEDTKIKLVAGEVNRVQEDDFSLEAPRYVCESAVETQATEKAFFDYHLYTLNQLTTLKDCQTKQICILSGQEIPYQQYYRLDLYDEKVDVMIAFENVEAAGLGVAIPKGKMKFYRADDADGALEFVGENQIDHTPKDERIELAIGKAFDVVFDFEESLERKSEGFDYYQYKCQIKNHKDTAIDVCFEPNIRGGWEMLEASHPYIQKNARQLLFKLILPAASETVVQYTYKVNRRMEVQVR